MDELEKLRAENNRLKLELERLKLENEGLEHRVKDLHICKFCDGKGATVGICPGCDNTGVDNFYRLFGKYYERRR